MVLSEIKFVKDKTEGFFSDAVNEFVRKHGVKAFYGYNAVVIERPNYVWRIWHSDPGYEIFLKYIDAHPGNKHLPKVLNKVRRETVNFKGDHELKYVKLEKLKPMPDNSLAAAIDEVSCTHYDPLPKSAEELAETPLMPRMKEQILENKDLFELILDLRKNGANDITENNIMLRGIVPVITDPFSHET